jgi:hypothetical protein
MKPTCWPAIAWFDPQTLVLLETAQKENSAPETIGDSVPDDVKLYPLPPEVIQKVPQAQSHQFFVKDDEVVLVSASDRRVADVIKKKPTDQGNLYVARESVVRRSDLCRKRQRSLDRPACELYRLC